MKKGNLFVSVEEAQEIISRTIKGATPINLKTENASGFVLAKSLKSPVYSPLFNHSAMDGYAFRFGDFVKGSHLQIEGESSAGTFYAGKLKSNQAVRIFTGAPIPQGADTVVMQEKTKVLNDKLTIIDSSLKKGSNIRLKGSQIKKGETAVNKDTLLNPGSIGFIASLGISEINVFPKPRIAVIVTGDELVSPGETLQPGQIFESNSHTLLAALSDDQFHEVTIFRVKDNFNATRKIFDKAIFGF
ncbi:MAG: molybdopterin molybdotransferase MoeA [Bacteroidetes bacterium]|nr:molybdopterin molybdotransferase MoeA [Bacteroidota bacterium]